jgi:hypothetical protein
MQMKTELVNFRIETETRWMLRELSYVLQKTQSELLRTWIHEAAEELQIGDKPAQEKPQTGM